VNEPRDTLNASLAAGVLETSSRDGQIVSAKIAPAAAEPTVASALAALLEAAPHLESLDLTIPGPETSASAIVELLLKRPRTGLRSLALRQDGLDPEDVEYPDEPLLSSGQLAAVREALPDLDELEIELPWLSDALEHPALRSLAVFGGSIRNLGELRLPRLRRLRWWIPGDVYGVAVSPEDLDPLWSSEALPELTELDLMDADLDGPLFTDALMESALFGRLKVLRLDYLEPFTFSVSEEVLPAHIARLAHLDRLEVRNLPEDEELLEALPILHAVDEDD
jgi:hypothetical protein